MKNKKAEIKKCRDYFGFDNNKDAEELLEDYNSFDEFLEHLEKVNNKSKWQKIKDWIWINLGLVGLILLVIVGIGFGIFNSNYENNNPSTSSDWSFYACEYAKKEIKAELKAPSSAKFESCDAMTIKNSGPNWTITGAVEAQNSFGVMLKNDFTVVLERIGQNKYNVISIDIK